MIDAAYEVAVEPHRQTFLEQHPGVALPDFLQPGVQSFAGLLQEMDAGEKVAGGQQSAVKNEASALSTAGPGHGWAVLSWPARIGTVALAFVLLYALVVLVLSVIVENDKSSGQAGRSERVTVDPPAIESVLGPDAQQAAEGFKHAGDGVLVRWATEAEEKTAQENCISGLSCFAVTVEMNGNCSGGIYIELKLRESDGTVVGMSNERTPAMKKGDRGVFAITGAVKAPKASIGTVSCH